MRVITGSAKGRTLFPVPGDSTRPVTDRVKEALFSILESQGAVEDARFLDLFGGTGAVGIEALSRGAAEAVFCEKDRRALTTIQKNLLHTAAIPPVVGKGAAAGRCMPAVADRCWAGCCPDSPEGRSPPDIGLPAPFR